jgi:hypothetical protein
MKAIKPMVYEALTPKQRVIATLEAEARDDQAEVRRLVETCPKVTYRANDARYANTMQAITTLSLALECELRGQALACAVASWQEHDTRFPFLRKMLTLQAAWRQGLVAKGIDPALVDALAAPIRDPFVTFFLNMAEKIHAISGQDARDHEAETGTPAPEWLHSVLEPKADEVAQWQALVEGYLEGVEG